MFSAFLAPEFCLLTAIENLEEKRLYERDKKGNEDVYLNRVDHIDTTPDSQFLSNEENRDLQILETYFPNKLPSILPPEKIEALKVALMIPNVNDRKKVFIEILKELSPEELSDITARYFDNRNEGDWMRVVESNDDLQEVITSFLGSEFPIQHSRVKNPSAKTKFKKLTNLVQSKSDNNQGMVELINSLDIYDLYYFKIKLERMESDNSSDNTGIRVKKRLLNLVMKKIEELNNPNKLQPQTPDAPQTATSKIQVERALGERLTYIIRDPNPPEQKIEEIREEATNAHNARTLELGALLEPSNITNNLDVEGVLPNQQPNSPLFPESTDFSPPNLEFPLNFEQNIQTQSLGIRPAVDMNGNYAIAVPSEGVRNGKVNRANRYAYDFIYVNDKNVGDWLTSYYKTNGKDQYALDCLAIVQRSGGYNSIDEIRDSLNNKKKSITARLRNQYVLKEASRIGIDINEGNNIDELLDKIKKKAGTTKLPVSNQGKNNRQVSAKAEKDVSLIEKGLSQVKYFFRRLTK